ncbi:hypothetical protein BR93DRAFT_656230 [Coniochaeta sp. PMI_546]|nr:hypothetical protein BR93DRAFT_656230 [Coniochaeta sp. PMI_546]
MRPANGPWTGLSRNRCDNLLGGGQLSGPRIASQGLASSHRMIDTNDTIPTERSLGHPEHACPVTSPSSSLRRRAHKLDIFARTSAQSNISLPAPSSPGPRFVRLPSCGLHLLSSSPASRAYESQAAAHELCLQTSAGPHPYTCAAPEAGRVT